MVVQPSYDYFRPSFTRELVLNDVVGAWDRAISEQGFVDCFDEEPSGVRIVWLKEYNNPPANRRVRDFSDELARFVVRTQDLSPESVEVVASADETVLEIIEASVRDSNVDYLVVVADSQGGIRIRIYERDAGLGFRELTENPMFERGGPPNQKVCVTRLRKQKFTVQEMAKRIPKLIRESFEPTKESTQRSNLVGPAAIGGAVAAWTAALAFRIAITRLWFCETCDHPGPWGRASLSFAAATTSGVSIGLSTFAGHNWGKYYSARGTRFRRLYKARFMQQGIGYLAIGGICWGLLRGYGFKHRYDEWALYVATGGSYFILVHLTSSLISVGAGMLAYARQIKTINVTGHAPRIQPLVFEKGAGLSVSGSF